MLHFYKYFSTISYPRFETFLYKRLTKVNENRLLRTNIQCNVLYILGGEIKFAAKLLVGERGLSISVIA